MERVREGVAILLKDVWHSAVVDGCGCVNPGIFWIKFTFSRVKLYLLVGYGPNEGDGEERYSGL